ncbi:hypothetical protein [Gordonia sp. NPDC003422]
MRHATILVAAMLALAGLGIGVGASVAAAPQLGDRCIGADIGRTTVDSRGNHIICDNYRWRLNRGQTPRHPWADEQRQWSECTAKHSTDWCRRHSNGR